MKKKGLIGTIIAAILVIALAVTLVATYLTLKYFVVVNWQLYPRHKAVLDISGQEVTVEEFEEIAYKLPDTRILWNVPFQGRFVPSGTKELAVTSLNSEDLKMIQYLPELKTVDAQGCTDYDVLLELYHTHPEITTTFTVPVANQVIPSDFRSITLTELSEADVPYLHYLPELVSIDGTRCRDFVLLEKLAQENPQWDVQYTNSIAGVKLDPDAVSLELTGASYGELVFGLTTLDKLQSLTVHDPNATGEELAALREEFSNVQIHWDVQVFDAVYGDDTTELDLTANPVDSVENAKEIASRFPALTKLIVDSQGIENEDMAAFREEVRQKYKVVWTVTLGKICKSRTDATYFMPIQQGDYYFNEEAAYNLRYCEDMICIDVGHAPIKTVDFAAFMPHLKYLILADTQVKSPDGLSNCKELIYLEVDHSAVMNLEPLLGCTALEDLNINECYAPIDPLLKMTWLKTLWVTNTDRGYSEKQALVEGLPDTRVVTVEIGSNTGMGWRNLQNYYDMRDCLGMYYMK